jgi:aspartyl-tRNA(Asn)/glutamyl-tRNA(Gln) amidotransferase subunit A
MLSSIVRKKPQIDGSKAIRGLSWRNSRTARRSFSSSRRIQSQATYPEPKSRGLPDTVSELVNQSQKLNSIQSSLLQLSLTEAVAKLRSGETNSAELVKASLAQAKRTSRLNAYISLLEEEKILERAEMLDLRRKEGKEEKLALEGLPIAVKDNYCVKDTYTTCGSKMLSQFKAPYDSTVTKRLENAGAIVIGKTNLDEFAMGSMTTKSAYGATVNPWSVAEGSKGEMLSSGGSSGGSAAAVAAFTSYAATGTDTGGSVRLPSSWTGLVGYKPTYGSSSRFGMVQYASSLDTPALFSRTVADMQLLAPIIRGPDPNDSTSVSEELFRSNSPALLSYSQDNKGTASLANRKIRVGIPREYFVKELSQEMLDIWHLGIQALQEQGCEIYDISLPHTAQALPAYYVIAPAEAASNLSRYDGVRYGFRSEQNSGTVQEMYSRTRSEGFGEEVQRRILIGNFALSRKSFNSYYKKALQIRRLVRGDFLNVFGIANDGGLSAAFDTEAKSSIDVSSHSAAHSSSLSSENMIQSVDVILTPTAPSIAPSIKDLNQLDPIHHYITDIMTIPVNLAGLPAVSVPVSFQGGLPVGLQLIAPHFHDDLLLQVAALLEMPWNSLGLKRYEGLYMLTKPTI